MPAPAPPVRPAADDSGFAILELLVAFVVFAIVATFATVAIADSMRVSNTTTNRVTATGLAQAAIDKARADTLSLTSGTTTSTSGAYTVTRTVTVPVTGGIRCAAGQLVPLTVSVTWRQTGARLVRIDTDLAC
jgi:prepilin-type N-terminal cleavage/methylation domain-containing protein